MLPFPQGESHSISLAFHECYLGLKDLNREDLDSSAREWISKLEQFMDTGGIEDSSGRGTWAVRADKLTENEKIELSTIIDELANWFHMCFWDRS
jgi:hypothetical protein